MRPGIIALAGTLAASSGAALAGSRQPASIRVAGCVSVPVHYEPGPRADLGSLPWVSAGPRGRRIDGYLFYYRRALEDPRVKENRGLVIYTGGGVRGEFSTKILWAPRRLQATTIRLLGTRLDGPGAFTQRFRVAGGGVFPSIVRVPEPGCWRLTIRNGTATVRLAVLAIDPA